MVLVGLWWSWWDRGGRGGTVVVLAGSAVPGVPPAGASLAPSPAHFATCCIGPGLKDRQDVAGAESPPRKASGVGWEEVPAGLLKFKKGLWKRDLIVHV